METIKKLGLWMDYSTAHLITPQQDEHVIIKSDLSPQMREEALKKGEKHLHHKEEQMQKNYFNEIAEKMHGYDQVLLFGPTDAKAEFHNYLKKVLAFKDLEIEVESTDKMTDNQKNAFVKKHMNV